MSRPVSRELFLSTQKDLTSRFSSLSQDILRAKLEQPAKELSQEAALHFAELVPREIREYALPKLEVLTSYMDEAEQGYRNFPSCFRERCVRIKSLMEKICVAQDSSLLRDIWVALQMLAIHVGRLNLEWNDPKCESNLSCKWNLESRKWVVEYPVASQNVKIFLEVWDSLNHGFDNRCSCYQCQERPGVKSGYLFGRSIFPQELLR